MIKNSKVRSRQRIKKAVRKKIHGTPERPRLSVYRSLNNIYVQIVDDLNGKTLLQVSTLSPELREPLKAASAMQKSISVGEAIAKRALENNITTVVFDRNGYRYHGRVKALADAARKGGLQF
jgi:large subunit ribosomal protein L18